MKTPIFPRPMVLMLAAGCFSTSPRPSVDFRGLTDGPDPCLLGGGVMVGGTSVRVGLPERIDPEHAPIPWNRSERFAFGHLYDALVRRDCTGRVGPGLARSWRMLDGGRRWEFEIDTALTFWNGGPLTAQIVARGLRRNESAAGAGFRPSLRAVRFSALDVTVLEVQLPAAVTNPALFADPVFALISEQEGTGRYVLDHTPSGALFLRSRNNMLPDLTFRINDDARDLVDARADVLATTDQAVARYAKSRRDFDAYPLNWSVRYVLLANDGFPPLPGTAAFRERMALEAVRAEARGAEGPRWWEMVRFCSADSPSIPALAPGRQQILYANDDPVARDLAQRIAAMSRWSAQGLPLPEVEAAIVNGTAAAVLALPIEFPAPCLLPAEWLNALRGYRIDALVDVRPHLVKAFLGPGAFAAYDGGFEFRLAGNARTR